jgi:hypothetical protein
LSAPTTAPALIRANPRRAFRRDLPWLVLLLPMFALSLWFGATQGDACASLFGIGRGRLLVAYVLLLSPLVILVAGAVLGARAARSLRSGYWPPLDSILYTDREAVTGTQARWRASAVLTLLGLCFILLAYVYARAAPYLGAQAFWQGLSAPEAACVAKPR